MLCHLWYALQALVQMKRDTRHRFEGMVRQMESAMASGPSTARLQAICDSAAAAMAERLDGLQGIIAAKDATIAENSRTITAQARCRAASMAFIVTDSR